MAPLLFHLGIEGGKYGRIKMFTRRSSNGSWCIRPVFSASISSQINLINRKQELKTRSICLSGDWSDLANSLSEEQRHALFVPFHTDKQDR
mmetsp:Transcript_3813/g.6608  ORF Transcript_3813/g.6608 Transcript_3813/m.6608 type:complete len:91 (+) Transcript_3813:363-635(+)